MKQYTKKPITVEAIQWDGTKEMAQELLLIPGLNGLVVPEQEGFRFRINTLEGRMTVSPGDYIIKGIQGEYYPCKPDIFEQSYTPVEEQTKPELDEKAPAPTEEGTSLKGPLMDLGLKTEDPTLPPAAPASTEEVAPLTGTDQVNSALSIGGPLTFTDTTNLGSTLDPTGGMPAVEPVVDKKGKRKNSETAPKSEK